MKNLAEKILQKLRDKKYTIATAESCTGGGIAYTLTDIAGCSDVVDRGFVTYSNQAKMDMLGVSSISLKQYGAVSQEVAIEMAEGAKKNGKVDIAVSVTGIAGPGGASDKKPVGLVHLAVATAKNTLHEKHIFAGNRTEIRNQTIETALNMVMQAISK
jgi:nicotinamide-nucleotide amidase